MKPSRKALVLVLATTLLVAALVLHRVWGAVVFAITVAYVLVPLQRLLSNRGLTEWWASTVATVGGSIAALVPFLLAGYLGYRRRDGITRFLRSVPDEIELDVIGAPYVVDVETLLAGVGDYLSDTAVSIAGGLPELGLKATVFAFVVFGLLMSHEAVEDALMAAVPPAYRDVMTALAQRAEQTLYGIYVLQAATAAATFVIALGVFWGLGYSIPVTLAFLAGILQFVPIVGPSVLVVGLAAYHVAVGDLTAAVWVVVLAGFLVAWLPDVLVRPRLSRRTGNLAGTLYFVGFVGGLLTVGPIGVVVGPVAVALVSESMLLLAEANHIE